MTDREKIEACDEVMRIVEDRIALEMHHGAQGRAWSDGFGALRADAFGAIVKSLLGADALPGLPV